MSAAEPQFDIVCGDVMDALRIGQIVQEGEFDAAVRAHPWLKPGQAFVVNRARFGDYLHGDWPRLDIWP